MELGEALYSKLSGTTDLTALVSTRIYPRVAPQNAAFPYVIFFQVSNPGMHAMGNDPNIQAPRWQVSSWADSYSSVRSVAKQVKAALKDYTGTMGGSSGIEVQRIFYENEVDMVDIDPETNEPIYHIAQDYIIWFSS